MHCYGCKKEVNRLSVTTIDGNPTLLCPDCLPNESRINYRNQVTLRNGVRIGAAHLEDIKRRHINPDGSVTRNYGRKYI